MNKACFIDRDGVLIEEKNYLCDPDHIEFFPETIRALKILEEHNFLKIVITNQAGVAKGYFSEENIKMVHRRIDELLLEHQVSIDDYFYCPHHPEGTVEKYARKCQCRKPGTALIMEAVQKFNINLSSSFLVGDKISDLQAGKNAGCSAILVETGHGYDHITRAKEEGFPISKDFYEAVDFFFNKLGHLES